MTDDSEPNSTADTAEPRRKTVRSLPTEGPSPHSSPPLLASNSSDDEAAVAAKQIVMEVSAQHLLTLGLETEQSPP